MLSWVSSDDVIVVAEDEIFKGILKWVWHKRSEREESFPELLQVHLTSISHEFLLNELLSEELVKTNLDCVSFVLDYLKLILNGNGESYTKPARKCLERNEDVIFVCGGRQVLCYYPSENKWRELMDTTLEHRDHSIIQYRDRVYILSKQGAERNQPQVAEYYMPTTNSWGAIQMHQFHYEEEFSSLFVLNGHSSLYALTNTETAPENTIYTYNLEENSWDIYTDCAVNRWGACGVADAHYIYLIGGTHNNPKNITATTKVEKIKPDLGVWKELALMIKARHNAIGAAMNRKIYVAGGMQENGRIRTVLRTCEVYNPSTNEWQILPSLNVPRHSASMVYFKGALYVVGGSKSSCKSK